MIAVSREHPLAEKQCLRIEDLYGETLMMVELGDSGVNDFHRNDLEKHHHQVHIENSPRFYDMSVFNRCAETKNILLTIECWSEVTAEFKKYFKVYKVQSYDEAVQILATK